jgi:hypothetical protein
MEFVIRTDEREGPLPSALAETGKANLGYKL